MEALSPTRPPSDKDGYGTKCSTAPLANQRANIRHKPTPTQRWNRASHRNPTRLKRRTLEFTNEAYREIARLAQHDLRRIINVGPLRVGLVEGIVDARRQE